MALPVVPIVVGAGLLGTGGFIAGVSFSEALGAAIQLSLVVGLITAVVAVLQRLGIVRS